MTRNNAELSWGASFRQREYLASSWCQGTILKGVEGLHFGLSSALAPSWCQGNTKWAEELPEDKCCAFAPYCYQGTMLKWVEDYVEGSWASFTHKSSALHLVASTADCTHFPFGGRQSQIWVLHCRGAWTTIFFEWGTMSIVIQGAELDSAACWLVETKNWKSHFLVTKRKDFPHFCFFVNALYFVELTTMSHCDVTRRK